MHDDLKELSEMIQAKMKYWSENSQYLNDNEWGARVDDMYQMMKNKAKSIIRKRKSDSWGKNFEKYNNK
jgi:hypothetical protein